MLLGVLSMLGTEMIIAAGFVALDHKFTSIGRPRTGSIVMAVMALITFLITQFAIHFSTPNTIRDPVSSFLLFPGLTSISW
jgi:hypothetical protein